MIPVGGPMTESEFGLIMRRLEELKTGQQRLSNRLTNLEVMLASLKEDRSG